MTQFTYNGGAETVTIVFPTRTITVSRGAAVDLSDDEAEAVSHLGWDGDDAEQPTQRKASAKTTTSKEADK